MKWTALWSLVMTGVMVTGCGTGGSSGSSSISSDSVPSATPINSAAVGSCPLIESYFSELLAKTNEARAAVDAAPLRFSLRLGKSAQDYAKNMATNNFFGHGEKGSFETRIRAAGYAGEFVGENLVAGRYTPGGAVTNWLNSQSHYQNLINPAYTEVGFGVFDMTGQSKYGRYWTQHLGSGDSQGGAYIPTDCGKITTATTQNDALQSATAGRSNIPTAAESDLKSALPKTAFSEKALTLPGNGNIPVGSLAFAIAGETNSDNTEIPEPALLLGLAGLGVALWRDRKVSTKKAVEETVGD